MNTFKMICELIIDYFIGLFTDIYNLFTDIYNLFKGIKPFLCGLKNKFLLFLSLHKKALLIKILMIAFVIMFLIFKFLVLTLLFAFIGFFLIIGILLFISDGRVFQEIVDCKYPYLQGTLLALLILAFTIGGAIIGYPIYEN